jgi:hypothetical protein
MTTAAVGPAIGDVPMNHTNPGHRTCSSTEGRGRECVDIAPFHATDRFSAGVTSERVGTHHWYSSVGPGCESVIACVSDRDLPSGHHPFSPSDPLHDLFRDLLFAWSSGPSSCPASSPKCQRGTTRGGQRAACHPCCCLRHHPNQGH